MLVGIAVDRIQVVFRQQDGRGFAVTGHGIDGIASGEAQEAGEANGSGQVRIGIRFVVFAGKQRDGSLWRFGAAEWANLAGEGIRLEMVWRQGGGLRLRGFADFRIEGLAIGKESVSAKGNLQAGFHRDEARIDRGPFFEKSERKRSRIARIEVLCNHLRHSSIRQPSNGRSPWRGG